METQRWREIDPRNTHDTNSARLGGCREGWEEEEVQSTAPGCLVCKRMKSGAPAETGSCTEAGPVWVTMSSVMARRDGQGRCSQDTVSACDFSACDGYVFGSFLATSACCEARASRLRYLEIPEVRQPQKVATKDAALSKILCG